MGGDKWEGENPVKSLLRPNRVSEAQNSVNKRGATGDFPTDLNAKVGIRREFADIAGRVLAADIYYPSVRIRL